MDNSTLTILHVFGIFVGWAAFSICASMLSSGRKIRFVSWGFPEHRLIAGGSLLIVAGLVAINLTTFEFDKLIKPIKQGFIGWQFEVRKNKSRDEADIEKIRSKEEAKIDFWIHYRDLISNLILLVSGGIGGGLITQGIVEKHQRRLVDKER